MRHVPGTGAHGFLLELPAAAPLDDLPCARCHDDDSMMSLPSRELPVGDRVEPLLAPARAEAAALFGRDG